MAKISCQRDESIDIVLICGDLDSLSLPLLQQTITVLRQQGSQKMVWDGGELDGISCPDLSALSRTVRIYRSTGGRIALARFPQHGLRMLQHYRFYRLFNVFESLEEAKQFLRP
jgi:anti-anti-sigma factor